MPNSDGLGWFVSEILPLIRRAKPDCTLAVVGRAPGRDILALAAADPRLRVTGTVPDVRPYLWGSRVSIVPLRVGGGTRLKIFEAMGMGRAVVSTTVGAEGLPVTDGSDVVIADSPRDLAAAVVTLIREPARRVQLERAARDLVVARYDWSAVAQDFEQALARVAAGDSPRFPVAHGGNVPVPSLS